MECSEVQLWLIRYFNKTCLQSRLCSGLQNPGDICRQICTGSICRAYRVERIIIRLCITWPVGFCKTRLYFDAWACRQCPSAARESELQIAVSSCFRGSKSRKSTCDIFAVTSCPVAIQGFTCCALFCIIIPQCYFWKIYSCGAGVRELDPWHNAVCRCCHNAIIGCNTKRACSSCRVANCNS